jgi:tellurite resistance protein
MPDTDPSFLRDLNADKLEALVEMMYLAATSDGEFSEKERRVFAKSAEDLTARAISRDHLETIIVKSEKAVLESGREARLQSVKERLPDLSARKLALSLAIRMTAADGVIRTSERELIMETAHALDIDGELAADMVRDMSRS